MLKSSKKIIISTEAVNSFGFRVLTAGIDLTQYRLNPVLLYNHDPNRLPLGFISDLEISGNALYGIPNFDDTDPFAVSIYNKVENGSLRMASAGLGNPVTSDDSKLMLPGQNKPTMVKCVLVETSITPFGANPEALIVELYDSARQKLNLSSYNATAVLSSLASNQTDYGFNDPNNDHSPVTLAIVQNALKVKKLTPAQAGDLLSLGTDQGSVDKIKSTIRRTPLDTNRLQGHFHPAILKDAEKPFNELKQRMPAGHLMNMKEFAPDLYRAKYFEEHGKMPFEMDGKILS